MSIATMSITTRRTYKLKLKVKEDEGNDCNSPVKHRQVLLHTDTISIQSNSHNSSKSNSISTNSNSKSNRSSSGGSGGDSSEYIHRYKQLLAEYPWAVNTVQSGLINLCSGIASQKIKNTGNLYYYYIYILFQTISNLSNYLTI